MNTSFGMTIPDSTSVDKWKLFVSYTSAFCLQYVMMIVDVCIKTIMNDTVSYEYA